MNSSLAQNEDRIGTALKGLLWMSDRSLKAAGFEFEVTTLTSGVSLGAWRNRFNKKEKPSDYKPRRFVFIPGFGDSALSWTTSLLLTSPLLTTLFDEAVLIDFPGYLGFQYAQDCIPTFDLMASVLSKYLDELRPHTVLTHSLGGWLAALHYSKTKNTETDQLICFDPPGAFGSPTAFQSWAKTLSDPINEGKSPFSGRIFHNTQHQWFTQIVNDDFCAFMQRPDITQFAMSIKEEHCLDGLLKTISVPKISVGWGNNDRLVPSSFANHWKQELPQATLCSLHECGHNPQLEAPIVTAKLLAAFLKDPSKLKTTLKGIKGIDFTIE